MSSAKSTDSAKDAAAAIRRQHQSNEVDCETLRQKATLCKAALNVHGQGGKTGDFEEECSELFMKYRLCMKAWRAAESEKRAKGMFY